MVYAQLDENNICVGVSNLADEIAEYNYTAAGLFISRMIPLPEYDTKILGLCYTNSGSWERVE